MNRQQDDNMSEYAGEDHRHAAERLRDRSDDTVGYDSETAFRVGHHRVAIPSEGVRQEPTADHSSNNGNCLNPRYIGTYFRKTTTAAGASGPISTKPTRGYHERHRRAVHRSVLDTQREHEAAIDRMRRRLDDSKTSAWN